jgi:hypothetical protein
MAWIVEDTIQRVDFPQMIGPKVCVFGRVQNLHKIGATVAEPGKRNTPETLDSNPISKRALEPMCQFLQAPIQA